MSYTVNQPAVGVAVLVRHGHKLLLSRRPNLPEQNHWQCAGGFLRNGEAIFECARRCVMDTGVEVSELVEGPYTNNVFADQARHSVTLYVLAQYAEGTPNHEWHWFDWRQLPQPMFLPLRLLHEHNSVWLAEQMADNRDA